MSTISPSLCFAPHPSCLSCLHATSAAVHGRRQAAISLYKLSMQKKSQDGGGGALWRPSIEGSSLLTWSDGKPVGSVSSVATLAASMVSIPVLGVMLGAPDSPSFITEMTQLSAALLILQAGIPSFRSRLVLLATSAACLLDVLASGIVVGNTSPALIASLLLSSSVFLAMKDGSAKEAAVGLGGRVNSEEAAAAVMAGEEEESSDNFDLMSWEENFGITMTRGENPRDWNVEEFCCALRDAGLEECVPAARRAKIDGMVAMTLTVTEEGGGEGERCKKYAERNNEGEETKPRREEQEKEKEEEEERRGGRVLG
ncbi:hypothetical protein GUITHDRAFT_135564 [Guillardia theta CCMP2712]|uniref:Uncharacterized protein n=1 Tax=Guillardia theta (strain CCMP2712) TaxID=905079 RepID=L1JNV9_GUITC|nr:hypothetical protein GUITHDRAFT_135564 [Guillardia theta CCMP2712]EKX49865.1 hypothetical protein GUITHDRAFT_135564 [Guillardia theta CCMP2712]|eukprot:XP_005836845.1 hypothetical protein GUITHDRAFT_135564 [Guillardia theta CCMP2712]